MCIKNSNISLFYIIIFKFTTIYTFFGKKYSVTKIWLDIIQKMTFVNFEIWKLKTTDSSGTSTKYRNQMQTRYLHEEITNTWSRWFDTNQIN